MRPHAAPQSLPPPFIQTSKPHNLDVDNYIRDIGKHIEKVHYNPRTSSTKIKQMVLAQHEAQREINDQQLQLFA